MHWWDARRENAATENSQKYEQLTLSPYETFRGWFYKGHGAYREVNILYLGYT
jgi:hypothetical protein